MVWCFCSVCCFFLDSGMIVKKRNDMKQHKRNLRVGHVFLHSPLRSSEHRGTTTAWATGRRNSTRLAGSCTVHHQGWYFFLVWLRQVRKCNTVIPVPPKQMDILNNGLHFRWGCYSTVFDTVFFMEILY